jgi:hypothetical protein
VAPFTTRARRTIDRPIAKGRATSRNFGDDRLIRMREAPLAIETHFIQGHARPTGFGEPPGDAVHDGRLRARLI